MPSDPLANLTVSQIKLLEQVNQLGSSTQDNALMRMELLLRDAERHILRAALEIDERLSACEAEIKALKQQRAEG